MRLLVCLVLLAVAYSAPIEEAVERFEADSTSTSALVDLIPEEADATPESPLTKPIPEDPQVIVEIDVTSASPPIEPIPEDPKVTVEGDATPQTPLIEKIPEEPQVPEEADATPESPLAKPIPEDPQVIVVIDATSASPLIEPIPEELQVPIEEPNREAISVTVVAEAELVIDDKTPAPLLDEPKIEVIPEKSQIASEEPNNEIAADASKDEGEISPFDVEFVLLLSMFADPDLEEILKKGEDQIVPTSEVPPPGAPVDTDPLATLAPKSDSQDSTVDPEEHLHLEGNAVFMQWGE